jgi:small-conductance mechanosensitive channel
MKWLALALGAAALHLLQRIAPNPWLGAAAWVLLSWILVRLGFWLLLEWPARRGLWQKPAKILSDLGQLLLFSALTLVILHRQAGVNLVGLVTTSAVLTAVLGLAAQQTLKDLFAGISLQLDPPFQLGDWVDLGEISGVVESLTLMNTRLRNLEGARIAIPNATVVQTGLRGFRRHDPVGTRLNFGLDYALPPDQAMAMIHTVLADHPLVLGTPAPQVWLQGYGDSALEYELLVWHLDARMAVRNRVRSDLLAQLWYALAREGWSIPFPVRDIQPRRTRRDRADPAQLSCRQFTGLLSANPLFAELTPSQLAVLAKGCRALRFGPGEAVIRQGETGDSLYQVVEGRLAVLVQSNGQPEKTVADLQRGDVFGEMGLFAGQPRTATVRALKACVLMEVQRGDLMPLLDAEPALVDRFATLIERRSSATRQATTPEPGPKDQGSGLAARIRLLLHQVRNG